MDPRRWLEVFLLASCVGWAAGQEDLTQPIRIATQDKDIKLVSPELHPNVEGNLETRCVVLTFPDVPRQPQTSNTDLPVANTTLPELSPKPARTCSPPETPTQVYDSESLFGALTGAAADVSLIREEVKNYFVAYNRERSFSKAQVLGMILVAMMAQHERIAAGINVLKPQIQSGGLEQEEPQIVVVCLPDGFKEERVLNECVENETGAMGSKTSYAQVGATSSTPPFQKEGAQQDEKREIRTVIDLLKGSPSKSLDNKVTQTYPPSRQPLSSFSSFVTSSEQQPPPATTPEVPATTMQSPPSEPHPVPENGLQPPSDGQTAAVLQLSVSGIIRAVLPLSISKMTAELSLSFAPVAQTSLVFPSTAKPSTSKSPSFLKPPLRLAPKTTKSVTSATIPTTAGTILPQTAADFTAATVHSSRPHTETSGSSTAAVASATTSSATTTSIPLKNISSSPPSEPTPYHSLGSPTTSSVISPTASQFSTPPSTMPASSELSNASKQLPLWVTSE